MIFLGEGPVWGTLCCAPAALADAGTPYVVWARRGSI